MRCRIFALDFFRVELSVTLDAMLESTRVVNLDVKRKK
jgi:hypothetical protein